MSTRIPPAPDLVEAAADYLESQVLPTLQGYHRFQTRIAVNVLRSVMRECRLASAHDDAEHERLRQLLGRDGALDSLRGELAAQLLDGRQPLDDTRLIAHLRQSLQDGLQIDNPKWAASPARDA